MISNFESDLFKSGFVTGLTRYSDHYPGYEHQNNIVIRVCSTNKDQIAIEIIVDTAGQCILDPAIAEQWGLGPEQGFESSLWVRGIKYHGFIVRKEIVIEAASGRNLKVDTAFFVPILGKDESWNKPNFIGLDGFLNHIRYAFSPSENIFFFAKV